MNSITLKDSYSIIVYRYIRNIKGKKTITLRVSSTVIFFQNYDITISIKL